MKKLLAVAITILITHFSLAQTKSFQLDAAGSKIKWLGEKRIGSSHEGIINFQSGSFDFEKGAPVRGEFVVDMTSIVCVDIEDEGKNAYFVGHLKDDDFFGVDKYPISRIVIESVSPKDNAYLLSGIIEIKGVKEAISFPAKIEMLGDAVKASAKLKIDRTKFGIRYGSDSFFDNLGDKAISNDFKLTIDLLMKAAGS